MSLSLVLVYMELSRKYFVLHKTLGKYITMFQYKIHTRNVPNKFFCAPRPIPVNEYRVSAHSMSRSYTCNFLVLGAHSAESFSGTGAQM